MIWLLVSLLWADAPVLLLPAPQLNYHQYRRYCERPPYLCVDDFYFDQIGSLRTPRFERLVDSFNAGSESFIRSLEKNIVSILSTEMLDTTQLDLLLKLLAQVRSPQLNALEQELKKIRFFLTGAQYLNSGDFAVFFKKKVATNSLPQWQLKIPLYYLHYAYQPAVNLHTPRKTWLLRHCPQPKLDFKLDMPWRALIAESCTAPAEPKRRERFTKEAYY